MRGQVRSRIELTSCFSLPLHCDYELAKQYSDITIECGDDIYYAHRLVICTQSSFFANACKPVFKVNRNKVRYYIVADDL